MSRDDDSGLDGGGVRMNEAEVLSDGEDMSVAWDEELRRSEDAPASRVDI